jgi:peptidoglycan hydrolase-like protein with peptidoglycan-binding domain
LVTGYFGQATQRAVTKIQAKCGLPQTGVIDENTTKCIFPVNYQVTVISPNGGETWDRSQIQTIKWNAVAISPATETETKTMPFWSKASIDLFRKQNVVCVTAPCLPISVFVKHLATVNLFDGSYSWKITNDISNSSDYAIRVSVGSNIVPLYRYEKEGVSFPPPEIWPVPSSTWDESDNSFTITGSVVPPSTDLSKVIEILQQISDQLAKAIQLLREMNQTQ